MEKKSSYIFSADVIRDIAILGVLIIHTANSVFARPDFFGGFAWWVTITLNSASRASIPLFIMLSGYLILRKEENFLQSLKRTLRRIFIPFIVWFLIYLLWNGGNPSLIALNTTIFSRIFTVNTFDLYFLVIMIGLYIVAPFLRSLLQKTTLSKQKNIMYILIAFGVLDISLQYIFGKCDSQTFFNMFLPYTGIFVAGYVLGNIKNIHKIKLATLFFLGFITTIVFSYLHFGNFFGTSFLDSKACLTFYTDYYLSPNVVLMTITSFLLLLNFNYSWIKRPVIRRLIHSFAVCSFGIYLTHTIFLDLKIYRLIPGVGNGTVLILSEFVFRFASITILSYIFTLLLLKIPFIKRILGA